MADAHRDDPEGADLGPLLAIMATLRSPAGCPWDRQQTHKSLKRFLIEEAYELLDALDAEDDNAIVDELGDVLLQVIFHASIAAETGRFTMQDVIDGLKAKLIRRHPHVFGHAEAKDAAAVARLWAEVKSTEAPPGDSSAPGTSILDNIARGLPALMEAEKLQSRAARVGFEWDDIKGAWDKVGEELDELREAINQKLEELPSALAPSGNRKRPCVSVQAAIEDEFGDVLFALVNVARYVRVDPEQSLRAANAKFRRRFRYIEDRAAQLGKDLQQMTLAEMDALWDEAKQLAAEVDG